MRKLFILLAFIGTIHNINSQVIVRPGIKAGLNVSQISNLNLDYSTGAYFGSFAHLNFSDYYTMQLELLYSGQGGKAKTAGENDIKYNYILFSMANKFFVSKNSGFNFAVGPSLELNLNSDRLDYNDGEIVWNSDSPSSVDFAILVGMGYEFDFGLMLEVRYKQGFLDVADFRNNLNDDLRDKSLNSVFQFGAAYKFDW